MMGRRSFITGALISVVTPVDAFVPAAVNPISALIASHEKASEEHGRMVKLSDEMFNRPDNPGMPYVMRSEIAPRWRLQFNKSRLEFRDTISKGFDEAIKTLEFNFETFRANASHYDEIVSATKAEKHRVLALYEAREKVYRDWRDVSGLTGVWDELNRLEDVRDELEKEIIAYRCETLDDVRIKLSFFNAEYGEEISGNYARHVLQNVLGAVA